MADAPSMWKIYDHPSDFPDEFVAQRWVLGGEDPGPSEDRVTSHNLDLLRSEMAARGLIRRDRTEGDDPAVIEVWV